MVRSQAHTLKVIPSRRSVSMAAARQPEKQPCVQQQCAISFFAPPGSIANSAIISSKPSCLSQDHDELRIVADQRGCPTSARDLAEAILRIAPELTDENNLYGTYHFAGTGATSWHGFATRIIEAQAQITGRHPRVTAITTSDYPTAARRPANSVLDCSLFERTFGFRANDWTSETDAITKQLAKRQQLNIQAKQQRQCE